jgi:hypothetical protein
MSNPTRLHGWSRTSSPAMRSGIRPRRSRRLCPITHFNIGAIISIGIIGTARSYRRQDRTSRPFSELPLRTSRYQPPEAAPLSLPEQTSPSGNYNNIGLATGTITAVSGNSVTIDVNSTSFTAWTSGGFQEAFYLGSTTMANNLRVATLLNATDMQSLVTHNQLQYNFTGAGGLFPSQYELAGTGAIWPCIQLVAYARRG